MKKLIQKLQAAINSFQVPETLTPHKAEFYKAGARAMIETINRALGEDVSPERTCVHCGCTDSHACPSGCSWVITHKATLTGICSECVAKEIKLVDSL